MKITLNICNDQWINITKLLGSIQQYAKVDELHDSQSLLEYLIKNNNVNDNKDNNNENNNENNKYMDGIQQIFELMQYQIAVGVFCDAFLHVAFNSINDNNASLDSYLLILSRYSKLYVK